MTRFCNRDVAKSFAARCDRLGCGKQQPILAEDIIACRIINGIGEIVELTNRDEDFAALKAGLGLLGLVSTVTIQCQQAVGVLANNQIFNYQDWFAQLAELQDSVDFSHTFWMPHIDRIYLVSANTTSADYGEYQCTNKRFWDRFSSFAISWLQRCGTSFPSLVPWLNRIMFAFGFCARQCTGDMYQVLSIKSKHRLYNCEYSFLIEIGKKVIEEIKVLTDSKKLLLPGLIEVRPIKTDKNFLSLAYGEEVLAIGCSVCSNGTEVPSVLYQLEEIFIRYQGRPHLVKNFSIDHAYLKKVYPKLEDF